MTSPKKWSRATRVLLTGAVLAVVLVSPARAHVTESFTHLWTQHIKPAVLGIVYTKAQSNSRYLGNLPTNAVLRGTFHAAVDATGAGEVTSTSVSYGRRLGTAPETHVIDVGDPAPAGCLGNATNPGASPGHLCIFLTFRAANTPVPIVIDDSYTGLRFGFAVYASSTGAGRNEFTANWIVKAA